MTDTPAYLSREVFDRLSQEFHVGSLVTMHYELGTGGPIRDVVGYGLDPRNPAVARPGTYSMAPIRYVNGQETSSRMNSGKKVTLLILPMARVVSIQAVYGA